MEEDGDDGAPRNARERVLHGRVLVAWPKVEGVQGDELKKSVLDSPCRRLESDHFESPGSRRGTRAISLSVSAERIAHARPQARQLRFRENASDAGARFARFIAVSNQPRRIPPRRVIQSMDVPLYSYLFRALACFTVPKNRYP